MKFTKMQGIGNDYIYVNAFEERVDDPGALSARISDRHFGVGADGLVLIGPSDAADFRMRMFNADGSEGDMCGNASRCIGKYVYDRGLTDKTRVTLETRAGIKVLELTVEGGQVRSVRVDMGAPRINCEEVPCLLGTGVVRQAPVTVLGLRPGQVRPGARNPSGLPQKSEYRVCQRALGGPAAHAGVGAGQRHHAGLRHRLVRGAGGGASLRGVRSPGDGRPRRRRACGRVGRGDGPCVHDRPGSLCIRRRVRRAQVSRKRGRA